MNDALAARRSCRQARPSCTSRAPLSAKSVRAPSPHHVSSRACFFGLWQGCHESRKCSRDTYPESYITKYTSIRRFKTIIQTPGRRMRRSCTSRAPPSAKSVRAPSEAVPHVVPICDGLLTVEQVPTLGALSPPRRARPGPGPQTPAPHHVSSRGCFFGLCFKTFIRNPGRRMRRACTARA